MTSSLPLAICATAALLLTIPSLADAQLATPPAAIGPHFPAYEASEHKVTGRIVSMGSDTMNNLMALWSEELMKHHPDLRIEIEGKGGGTAVGGLLGGLTQVGPMSRQLKPQEIEALEKELGSTPVQLATCHDRIAVFVHKDNPLRSLSLQQVDAIFSSTRRLGHDEDIETWGQLGLEGEWADASIHLYGRNSASGTYGFFKKVALGKGDYKGATREQPGSSAVVLAVSEDRFGIGYSGAGYKTEGVKMLGIAPTRQAENPIRPDDPEHGTGYPLGRPLLLTLKGGKLTPALREFLRLIYSNEGQQIVVKDGYIPLNFEEAVTEAKRGGIEVKATE